MSQKPWNDLTPTIHPVVERGPQTLWVWPWTRTAGGLQPHVVIRVGQEIDSQAMQLTPAEARRIAVALLLAAEKVESEK
jgi:hypothetical protein